MWTWKSCLRFTIREYSLLVVIVGLALAWRLDHDRLSRGFRYTGQPLDLAIQGQGFFTLVQEMGLLGRTADALEKEAFWVNEVSRAHEGSQSWV